MASLVFALRALRCVRGDDFLLAYLSSIASHFRYSHDNAFVVSADEGFRAENQIDPRQGSLPSQNLSSQASPTMSQSAINNSLAMIMQNTYLKPVPEVKYGGFSIDEVPKRGFMVARYVEVGKGFRVVAIYIISCSLIALCAQTGVIATPLKPYRLAVFLAILLICDGNILPESHSR